MNDSLTEKMKAIFTWRIACICIAVAIACAVVIGVVRNNPSPQDEDVAVCYMWEYVSHEGLLSADIEDGSYWTDGSQFFTATQTGKSIRMEGGTLHEGGCVCAFEVVGDSLLQTSMPEEGYNSLAEPGLKATHHKLTSEDGRTYELLVILSRQGTEPVSVLQRYDDNSLDFHLAVIQELLTGTFEAAEDAPETFPYKYLQFHKDGTVQMSAEAEPQPYNIEMAWDFPTNVLSLPDGHHVGVELQSDGALKLYDAEYDRVEEFWTITDYLKGTLHATSKNAWPRNIPVTDAVLTVIGLETLCDVADQINWTVNEAPNPLTVLNKHLINSWKKKAEQEAAEEAALDEGVE